MNLTAQRLQALARGQRLKPCFTTFYNLGQRMAGQLKPVRTTREAAANLGMPKRKLETICYVALGKVVYAMLEFERDGDFK